jgi:hypothetical protein
MTYLPKPSRAKPRGTARRRQGIRPPPRVRRRAARPPSGPPRRFAEALATATGGRPHGFQACEPPTPFARASSASMSN